MEKNYEGKTMGPILNFVSENVAEKDKELFFGPVEPDDEFIIFPSSWTMAHVVHVTLRGIFPLLVKLERMDGTTAFHLGLR